MVETDGGFYNDNQKVANLIRSYAYTGAKVCFSTSKIHDNYYKKLGVKPEKIVRYPFTSIFENEIIEKPLSNREKLQIKNRLFLEDKKIIITVGRFVYGKGIDILIKACSKLDDSVQVVIIGGKPTREYVRLIEESDFKNFIFLDFMDKVMLFEYLKSADLFVLPTRSDAWGLVINEAMANGLPVITTTMCNAGLELVEDTINGYIIKQDDYIDLYEKMITIINRNKTISNFSKNSIEKIKKYTIENMVKQHIKELIWKYFLLVILLIQAE